MKVNNNRSCCPIGKTLDVVGDRWSLLILRSLIFTTASSFTELSNAPEHIAPNILSARLERLEQHGLIGKRPDGADHRKCHYFATDKGLDLMPVLMEMISWGMKYHDDASYPEKLVEAAVMNRPRIVSPAHSRR